MGYSRQKKYKIFFGVLLIFISLYGFSKLIPFLSGSTLSIEGIKNGENHGPVAFISGKINNGKEVRLNGNILISDRSGNFTETILLHPGYNLLNFSVKDTFGRQKNFQYEITADENTALLENKKENIDSDIINNKESLQ